MSVDFIAQPQATFRIGDFLKQSFADPRWTEFRATVAFVKRSGTKHIREPLEAFSKRGGAVKISAGIDAGGTSAEGLTDLILFESTCIEGCDTFYLALASPLGLGLERLRGFLMNSVSYKTDCQSGVMELPGDHGRIVDIPAKRRAQPGSYVGQVREVLPELGLARLVTDNADFEITVPLWKFPHARAIGVDICFSVGNYGGVTAVALL